MGNDDQIVGFDEKNFQSDEYQRPYHYLMHYENRVGDIPVFNRNIKETDKKQCLQVLTRWVYYKTCKHVFKRLTKTNGMKTLKLYTIHVHVCAFSFSHCCVENPSWSELRNFIHFLNTQLQDFEKSVYCSAILKQDLPGFPAFVLRFLIQMSKVIFLPFCIKCLNAKYRIMIGTNFDKHVKIRLFLKKVAHLFVGLLWEGFFDKVIRHKWGEN